MQKICFFQDFKPPFYVLLQLVLLSICNFFDVALSVFEQKFASFSVRKPNFPFFLSPFLLIVVYRGGKLGGAMIFSLWILVSYKTVFFSVHTNT